MNVDVDVDERVSERRARLSSQLKKTTITQTCTWLQHHCKPFSPTRFVTCTLAPAFSRARAASGSETRAANINGVSPLSEEEKTEAVNSPSRQAQPRIAQRRRTHS